MIPSTGELFSSRGEAARARRAREGVAGAVAARRMAGNADEVPPVPRRPHVHGRVGAAPRPRAAQDRGRRDGRRPLCRPQPSGRAGRTPRRIRRAGSITADGVKALAELGRPLVRCGLALLGDRRRLGSTRRVSHRCRPDPQRERGLNRALEAHGLSVGTRLANGTLLYPATPPAGAWLAISSAWPSDRPRHVDPRERAKLLPVPTFGLRSG